MATSNDDVMTEVRARRGESSLHIAYRLLGQGIPAELGDLDHVVAADVRAKSEEVQEVVRYLHGGTPQIRYTLSGIVAI